MKITIDFKDATVEKPNPKNDFETFLIVTNNGYIINTNYSSKHELFNTCDFVEKEDAKKTAIYPKWWAEIPPELLAQEDYDGQKE